MSNDYYVYIHRRESDNKVFYVGKGKGNRAMQQQGRNRYWQNTYQKHGLIVEMYATNLTEDQAFTLEIATIAQMRAEGEPLTNLTSGGEGLSGYTKHIHVSMLNKTFNSVAEIVGWFERSLGKEVCARYLQLAAQGKRKMAYGLQLQYVENNLTTN